MPKEKMAIRERQNREYRTPLKDQGIVIDRLRRDVADYRRDADFYLKEVTERGQQLESLRHANCALRTQVAVLEERLNHSERLLAGSETALKGAAVEIQHGEDRISKLLDITALYAAATTAYTHETYVTRTDQRLKALSSEVGSKS